MASGLKSQICDSSDRERSAKRMVKSSGISVETPLAGGGKVAAKTQCLDGMLWGAWRRQ